MNEGEYHTSTMADHEITFTTDDSLSITREGATEVKEIQELESYIRGAYQLIWDKFFFLVFLFFLLFFWLTALTMGIASR